MCKPKELSRKQKIKMKAEINKMVNKKKKKSRKINQTKGWFCEKVYTSYVSEKTSKFEERRQGNSLAVQGLVQVQSLVRELRSCKPCGTAKK